MRYEHLGEGERGTIAEMLWDGAAPVEIALKLGRHPCTIRREVARNGFACGRYESKAAVSRAGRRRKEAGGKPRKLKGALRRSIHRMLCRGWTPDVIAGRLRLLGEECVSARAIYDYLHRMQRAGSHHRPYRYLVRRLDELPPFCHLPVGLGRYQKRGKAAPPLVMSDASPIALRPAEADARAELGHYEVDTAVVKGGVLLAAVCRRTRFFFLRKLPNKSAGAVEAGLRKMLSGYPVKTITSDRGSEFARWRELEKHFGAKWHVCLPRRPDQRGSVEGLLRQMRRWLPKRMPAAEATPAKLAGVVRRLNNIPRKSLGYKTPAEVMAEMLPETAHGV